MYHHRCRASMKQTSPSFLCKWTTPPPSRDEKNGIIFGKGKKRGGLFWEFNSFIFGHWGDQHEERIGHGKVVLRLFQMIIKQHWREVSHSFFDTLSSYPFKSLLLLLLCLLFWLNFRFFHIIMIFFSPFFQTPPGVFWGNRDIPGLFQTKTGGFMDRQVPSKVLARTCAGIAESLGPDLGGFSFSSVALEVQDPGCNWFLL